MDLRDVIRRPVITEKSMLEMEDNKYTFIVDPKANKTLVKQAVEALFDVKVEKVNIINTARKPKRLGMFMGYTRKNRKAIVKLTEDSTPIELFASAEEESED